MCIYYTVIGCLVNNLPHGNDGVCTYGDASTYSGQWRNGKRNGYGVYTTAKQESYEGKWVNDLRCGKGVWKSALTAEYYEGTWDNHLPHGVGKRVYSDKNIYTGEFNYGTRHGVGTMVYQSLVGVVANKAYHKYSATYTGNWYKNMRHGEGKWSIYMNTLTANASIDSINSTLASNMSGMSIIEGSIPISNPSTSLSKNDVELSYEGNWFEDKRNGLGTSIYQSGYYYNGLFEDDVPKA